jgi:hypothetical protein
MLGGRQQDYAARLPDPEGRLHVPREEQPLDAEQVRLVEAEQFIEERMDRKQPFRQTEVRAGDETPVVDLP